MAAPSSHLMQPNVPRVGTLAELRPRFWVALVLTGVGAGFGGIVLMDLLRAVQHLCYDYRTGSFLSGVDAMPVERRVVVLAFAGVVAGVAFLLLRRIFSKGTGLLEAVWERTGELAFLGTMATAATEMVIVAMGASLGREGAPKDAGAAIASKLSDLVGLSSTERRLLVACGAGAGLAAVYNVPLAGALFTLEVLLGTLTLPLVLPALTAASIATAISWIGLPDRPVYHVPITTVSASAVLFAVVLGPIVGVVAVGYVRLIAWAKDRRPCGWWLVGSTTVVFTALGGLAVGYPQLLGNGLDLAQLAFLGAVGLPLLAVLAVLKPLATAACLRSGAVGGLLTPTLCFGSLLGGLAGDAWVHVWSGPPVAVYAILGAGAILAAAMQAPLTAIVLMGELTNHTTALIVPLLIVIAGATVVARLLDERSIYSAPLRAHEDREVHGVTAEAPAPAGTTSGRRRGRPAQ